MKKLLLVVAVIVAGGAGFTYSGLYEIGADVPHWSATTGLIKIFRERSIAVRLEGIEVPQLGSAELLREGAEHYSAMCSDCHLAPGMDDTEIRMGLNPKPANLAVSGSESEDNADFGAARQFWIIKHGIKMTAMPAWGVSHDDQSIWGLVAFLQKLPALTPDEYAALTGGKGHVKSGAHSEAADHAMHHHGNTDAEPLGHVDAPGAPPHSHGDDKHSGDKSEGDGHAH